MKQIVKLPEPQELIDWKTANPGASYKDLSDTRYHGGPAKAALRRSLIAEQHHICCYCECLIKDGDFHIEHFRPKSDDRFKHLQLEYTNLHASCVKTPNHNVELVCGHKKHDAWSPLLVSPLDPDCDNHFKYLMNGEIKALDSQGETTIDILALDSQLLTEARKKAIDHFLNDIEEEEIEDELNRHLDTTASVYGEFYSMIAQLRHKLMP